MYFLSWGTSLTILFKPYKQESCHCYQFHFFHLIPITPPIPDPHYASKYSRAHTGVVALLFREEVLPPQWYVSHTTTDQ